VTRLVCEKITLNVSQPIFLNECKKVTEGTKTLDYFWNFQKMPKVNDPPIGEKSPNLVTLGSMITIFCDFWQFSAIFGNFRQKIGDFLKNQCYDPDFA
jgi:hypothetical protein